MMTLLEQLVLLVSRFDEYVLGHRFTRFCQWWQLIAEKCDVAPSLDI